MGEYRKTVKIGITYIIALLQLRGFCETAIEVVDELLIEVRLLLS